MENTNRFENRVSMHPNRRLIKVISQTPTEIVADIEMQDNPTVIGTPISADILNGWDNDVIVAKQKSETAEQNSSNAVSMAQAANTKSEAASELATEAGSVANEAKTIAQTAIEQVISKQGTKVSENGSVVETFNADKKVNVMQNSANKVLVTNAEGSVVASSVIPIGEIKVYKETDENGKLALVIEYPDSSINN